MFCSSWQDDHITCRVSFSALIAPALAVAFKNDNHLLSLVKMPGHRHTWTEDVFMDVRQRTELLVCDEISNAPLRAARIFAKDATENAHG